MRRALAFLAVLLAFPTLAWSQTTWYVDDDNCPGPGSGTQADPFCRIQDGVDATVDGDTVLVLPGTYLENIDFFGKAITLVSSEGPGVTIIDGSGNGTVVTFENSEGPTSRLEGFTISNGYSAQGGGLRCIGSSPTLCRNIIQKNTARIGGGGIYLSGSSSLIASCVVSDNDAWDKGDGILCRDGSSPRIIGTTIAHNSGDGLWVKNSSAEITNSISWFNSGNQIDVHSSDVNVTFSDVDGGWPGTGNIDLDPVFVSAKDMHLFPTSPCIDSGAEAAGSSEFDIDGDKRVRGRSVDMGADEAFKRDSPPDRRVSRFDSTTSWYVDQDNCPGPGSGTAIDPFCTIQDAIDAAHDGDTVLVMPGKYVENIDYLGKAITVRSDGDGDPGTEDIALDTTIIDGGFSGPVVRFRNEEGLDSVLEGFTITDGFDSGSGGGVYCSHSSPTITQNTIADNFAHYHSDTGGGGIGCFHSSALIANNTITANHASWAGGGIGCLDSSPTITNNLITENYGLFGGAIYCAGSSAPIISHNTITGNSADNSGGIECYCPLATITHNTIMGNSAEWDGGGMTIVDSPTVAHNIIAVNFAGRSGGGVYFSRSAAEIINNTFTGNTAEYEGGGIACHGDSRLLVTNTILWNDGSPHGPEIWADPSSSPVVAFCDVKGGWPGEGNLDADPLLIGSRGSDDSPLSLDDSAFRLRSGSPCIDAGDPTDDSCTEKDFHGFPRVLDGNLDRKRRIDMGASEFDNIRLTLRGDATPGGTLTLITRGMPGLPVITLVGTGSGSLCHPDWGAVFIDFANPWWLFSWGTIPSNVAVTIPPDTPTPLPIVFQELALSGTAGNMSNPVEIMIE